MTLRIPARPPRRAVALAAALALGLATAAQAAVTFQVTPIAPPPGFSQAVGFGLNNRGDVVGELRGSGGLTHAFVWRDGVLTDLSSPSFGNGLGSALAINDAGLIAGTARNAANLPLPALWQPGSSSPQILSTSAGTANAVNAAGIALVTLEGSNGSAPTLLRTNVVGGGLVPVLPGARGRDINDAGTTTGSTEPAGGGGGSAFRLGSGGVLRLLPGLSSAAGSAGHAINNANQIAGVSVNAADEQRAVLWSATNQLRDLGVLGVFSPRGAPSVARSRAEAINEAGVVVGSSTTLQTASAAFYWTERAGMQTLPLATAGVTLLDARAVNELGQVLVQTTQGAALLTPTGRLFWGGGSGSFADGARWNPTALGVAGNFDLGLAPNRFLDASIPALAIGQSPAVSVVTMDRSAQLRSMNLGGGAGSTGSTVELRLSSAANPRTTLDVPGGLLVQAGGTLSGTGTVNGDVTVSRNTSGAGRIAPVDLRINGVFTNRGDVVGGPLPNAPGALFTNVVNEATGRVTAGADRALQVAGSEHRNLGVFEASGVRSQLRVFGHFANLAGGVVQAREGTVEINGIVTNDGTLRADPRGQLRLRSTLVNNGTVLASVAGRVTMEGVVSGAGSFGGPGDFEFLGGFAPGNSPAHVSVGNALFAGGDIVLDLGGSQPGVQHDQVLFTGHVAFAPGVALRLEMGDFQVHEGDRFQLFDFAAGNAGALDFSLLPVLGNGLRWDTADMLAGGWLGVSAVPEPQAWLLALAGLPLLLRRRLRGAGDQ